MELQTCLLECLERYSPDDYTTCIYHPTNDLVSPFSLENEAEIIEEGSQASPQHTIFGNASGIIQHWQGLRKDWECYRRTNRPRKFLQAWQTLILYEGNLGWTLGLENLINTPPSKKDVFILQSKIVLSAQSSPFLKKFEKLLIRHQNKGEDLEDCIAIALDDMTPYYQFYLRNISRQKVKIVQALAESKEKEISVRDMAKWCLIPETGLSSQLHELRALGYVVNKTRGRESYYQLRDPLFRIWLSSRRIGIEGLRNQLSQIVEKEQNEAVKFVF